MYADDFQLLSSELLTDEVASSAASVMKFRIHKSTEHLAKLISLRLHFPSIFSSSWISSLIYRKNNFIIIPLHISPWISKISSIHLSFNTSKIRVIIFFPKSSFPLHFWSTEDHREYVEKYSLSHFCLFWHPALFINACLVPQIPFSSHI